MAPDRLRATLTAMPFRPFVAEVAGGKRVAIDHPDYASLSPSGRTLIVYGYPKDDSMEILDVFLISNLSVKGGSETAAA
jgi:hypothetical protein